MNTEELIAATAAHSELTTDQVARALTIATMVVKREVAHGNKVTIDQFGTFGARSEARVTGPYPIKGLECPRDERGQYIYELGGYEPWFAADEAFLELTRAVGGKR
jgi:nucleoid DNA-binding protein